MASLYEINQAIMACVDTETGEINVVYKRNDGGYGLISPEIE